MQDLQLTVKCHPVVRFPATPFPQKDGFNSTGQTTLGHSFGASGALTVTTSRCSVRRSEELMRALEHIQIWADCIFST
jgi:hypothetical protein